MGDRCHAYLYLPQECIEKAIKLSDGWIPSDPREHVTCDWAQGAHVVQIEFDEINYGRLPFQDELTEAGIPFNLEHGSGCEYQAGFYIVRFTEDGLLRICEGFDDAGLNEAAVKGIVNNSDLSDAEKITELKVFLDRDDFLHCEPHWDNQVEYGKRYRANRLINPNEEYREKFDEHASRERHQSRSG